MGGRSIAIVAPHGDDELIGCYELIVRLSEAGWKVYALYWSYGEPDWGQSQNRLGVEPVEAAEARKAVNAAASGGKMSWDWWAFPDPHFETHPLHRAVGAIGEAIHRDTGRVIFYNVNMTAPYIREVKNPSAKREMLDIYYPKKADLWTFDHKYVLFEGQTLWLVGPELPCLG